VNFTSDGVAAREAPVTEFAPFQVAADTASSDKSSLEDKVLALGEEVKSNNKCLSYAVGWGRSAFSDLCFLLTV
jgi:hypothetical protein